MLQCLLGVAEWPVLAVVEGEETKCSIGAEVLQEEDSLIDDLSLWFTLHPHLSVFKLKVNSKADGYS